MEKEYEIGNVIEIKYKNQKVRAKILDIKQINNEYTIYLSINNKEIPFCVKDLGLKVLELDELGIKLIEN
ncbi:MAG: hypothetical protein QXK80_01980 [Candidatus Pacearchaeota archaeon]